ncbi:CKS-domain-containing protein, partial [Meredithblackwellia eburnea MCA 4105]
RYSDDEYEYRHVILPNLLILDRSVLILTIIVHLQYFADEKSRVLRLLSDQEWRSIGIVQSIGWQHYEVHEPEPHILLFRRERNYQAKVSHSGDEASGVWELTLPPSLLSTE